MNRYHFVDTQIMLSVWNGGKEEGEARNCDEWSKKGGEGRGALIFLPPVMEGVYKNEGRSESHFLYSYRTPSGKGSSEKSS